MVKAWGTYDYWDVSGLVWGGGNLDQFYAEASQNVNAPSSGFCTIVMKFYESTAQEDHFSIAVQYIIGS